MTGNKHKTRHQIEPLWSGGGEWRHRELLHAYVERKENHDDEEFAY